MVDYTVNRNNDYVPYYGNDKTQDPRKVEAEFTESLERQSPTRALGQPDPFVNGSQKNGAPSSALDYLMELDTGKDGLTFEDFQNFKFTLEAKSAAGDMEALEALNRIGDIIGSEHPQSFAEEEAMKFIESLDTEGDGVLTSAELEHLGTVSAGDNSQQTPDQQGGGQGGDNPDVSLNGQNMYSTPAPKVNGQTTSPEDEIQGTVPTEKTGKSPKGENGNKPANDGVTDNSEPQPNEFISEGITSTKKTNGKAEIGGGGPNTINLVNTTDEPMEVAFFRNFAPYEPNHVYADGIFTLQPGEKLEVSMPDEWQGRVQKWNGTTQNFANWAEINFESSTDLIWFNESDIPGRNAAMRITSADGQVAGSLESILDKAPKELLVQDSSGEWVLRAPEWFTGEYSQGSVDFLNEYLGTENAYVLPPDHDAVRRSQSDTLTIEFGAG